MRFTHSFIGTRMLTSRRKRELESPMLLLGTSWPFATSSHARQNMKSKEIRMEGTRRKEGRLSIVNAKPQTTKKTSSTTLATMRFSKTRMTFSLSTMVRRQCPTTIQKIPVATTSRIKPFTTTLSRKSLSRNAPLNSSNTYTLNFSE